MGAAWGKLECAKKLFKKPKPEGVVPDDLDPKQWKHFEALKSRILDKKASRQQAKTYLTSAAYDDQLSEAYHILAFCRLNGWKGFDFDFERGLTELNKAVDMDDPTAQWMLSRLYRNSFEDEDGEVLVEKNDPESLRLLNLAVSADLPQAKLEQVKLYQRMALDEESEALKKISNDYIHRLLTEVAMQDQLPEAKFELAKWQLKTYRNPTTSESDKLILAASIEALLRAAVLADFEYNLALESNWQAKAKLELSKWLFDQDSKEESEQWLFASVNSSDQSIPEAFLLLGKRFYRGELIANEEEETIITYLKSVIDDFPSLESNVAFVFKIGATHDFPGALFEYSSYLFQGHIMTKNVVQSNKYLLQSATFSYPPAMQACALHFFNGDHGFEVDVERAKGYLEKAVDRWYKPALCYLAECQMHGWHGYEKDKNAAVALFKTTANLGHAESAYHYGRWCYKHPEHRAEGMRYLYQAAKAHYAPAQYTWATYFFKERRHHLEKIHLNEPEQLKRAMRYLEKIRQANPFKIERKHLNNARFFLGLCHWHGFCGVEKNKSRALHALFAAKKDGCEKASSAFDRYVASLGSEVLFRYARHQLTNTDLREWDKGVPRWHEWDVAIATIYLEKLIDRKYSPALCYWGCFLVDGKNGPSLNKEAKGVSYLKQAADLGDPWAAFRYGMWHFKQHHAMDLETKKYLRRSANAGCLSAQYVIVKTYTEQTANIPDQELAIQEVEEIIDYLKYIANAEHADRDKEVARTYETDPNHIAKLEREIAKKVNDARYWLARYLDEGRYGLERDRSEAIRYATLAKDAGNQKAQQWLDPLTWNRSLKARDLEKNSEPGLPSLALVKQGFHYYKPDDQGVSQSKQEEKGYYPPGFVRT